MVQFQVIIAHQLLLANFVVNIWYATLHSEHIFCVFRKSFMLVVGTSQLDRLCVLVITLF
jgi:hypothetical protein